MKENIWRKDFPILDQKIYGKPLVYLDNAATSQVSTRVVNRVEDHYLNEHANIHRGIHYLSEKSTEAVEKARETVQTFIGAESSDEIIFTQGTTDSIHLVADGIAQEIRKRMSEGESDSIGIVTTQMEHHSNFVPWQQACRREQIRFFVCPAPDGELDLDALGKILKNNSIRLVACAHVSNLTGTVNPLDKIIPLAHRYGAEVLVDGAQGILHQHVDVKELDCDYYCFSGHKMTGPTGIGVLYGKRECLEKLEPVRFGGGMVDIVTEKETTWGPLPHRFEAGTPNIAGIIGLGAAVDYLTEHDFDAMHKWEEELMAYAAEKIGALPYVRIIGHPQKRAGAIAFVVDGAHPYDIASIIDKYGVAVRTGNHCAQPMLKALGESAAVRVSPAFYNTKEEIDLLCDTLNNAIAMLRKYQDA